MNDSYNWWSVTWRAGISVLLCSCGGHFYPTLYEPITIFTLGIPWIILLFALIVGVVVYYTT